MGARFVFLHVGPDASQPRMLVRSLRSLHAGAEIIQCSDRATAPIEGVDRVFRCKGDTCNLMTCRLESFSALALDAPAIYLDTDMLCVNPVDPEAALGDGQVAVCNREFNHGALLNTRFGNLDLAEYTGKTLGEVYPFVACATVTADAGFWVDCRDNLATLHPKFRGWYGDQEAIRNVVNSGKYRHTLLPESLYGCLPDQCDPRSPPPRLLHFKGVQRKPLMVEFARRMRLA